MPSIALIAINLGYFQQLIDDIRLGHQGAATIVQTDGFILAHNPPSKPCEAANVANSPTFPPMLYGEERFVRCDFARRQHRENLHILACAGAAI